MSALSRFIARVGVIASILVLSFSPVPAHAQLLWEHEHGWTTEAVVFSLDSKTLIAGSTDLFGDEPETITMWDVDTGAKTATIEGLSVNAVALSPDGTMLAAGYGAFSDDAHIRLWDVATETHIVTFEGHDDNVDAVDFSPDGKVLISGSQDHTVRLWDVAAESHIATIEVDDNVGAVRFSPDGSLFATADSFDDIKLWSTAQWITTTTSISDDTLPTEVSLAQNYPNPFNPSTEIEYSLSQPSSVRLAVYDMAGRTVAVLIDGIQPQGRHTVRFNVDGLPTGTYVYRLTTGSEMLTRAMTLVR